MTARRRPAGQRYRPSFSPFYSVTAILRLAERNVLPISPNPPSISAHEAGPAAIRLRIRLPRW